MYLKNISFDFWLTNNYITFYKSYLFWLFNQCLEDNVLYSLFSVKESVVILKGKSLW